MDDLPKKVLSNIATYLGRERVLFSVALTAPSSSWEKCDLSKVSLSSASKIVMTSPFYQRWYKSKQYEETWDDLNFFGMDEDVRRKLRDGDICGILSAIPRENLKELSLPHCVGIQGHCLSPLRGSVVLEEVDLSLCGWYGSKTIDPTPNICENEVLPILNSILDKDGSSLRYMRLPKKWRERQSLQLGQFLEKYNQVMNSRNISCSHCESICIGSIEKPWISYQQQAQDYGIQNMTCHYCMKNFCQDCLTEHELQFCPCCEGKFCDDNCTTVETCIKCNITACEDCKEFYKCNVCNKIECQDCHTTSYCDSCEQIICTECTTWVNCKNISCNVRNCADCAKGNDIIVKQCKLCGDVYCKHNLCNQMEYCWRICGDICMDCHSKTHDITECYWQLVPSKVQQTLHSFTEREINLYNLVQFWEECTQLQSFGTDKEFDLNTFKNIEQAKIATAVIVVDFLLKDKDPEAVYMMFYCGLLKEITERGPDFMVKMFEKKSELPKEELACTYFTWSGNYIKIE